jgi:SAM-dependent methyltransferase
VIIILRPLHAPSLTFAFAGIHMSFWNRIRWSITRQFYQARNVVVRLRIGERWEQAGGLAARKYPDYETYLAHQAMKFGGLRWKTVAKHDRRFHEELSVRLRALAIDFRGRSVLCLAARQGSEVRAFIDQGAFAVGIDLNPGPRNRFVVVGDFHELQFADASLDYVYTNSLDHAFDLNRIMKEVRRVLKPTGRLIVEANMAGGEGAARGAFESLVWANANELVQRIEESAFRVAQRESFDLPWKGEQIIFARD